MIKVGLLLKNNVLPVASNLHCGVLLWVGINLPAMVSSSPSFEAHIAVAPLAIWQSFYIGFAVTGYCALFLARQRRLAWVWEKWSILAGIVFFVLASIISVGGGTIFSTGVSTYTLLGVNSWLQVFGLSENGNLVRWIR